jgi:hypothetical protein
MTVAVSGVVRTAGAVYRPEALIEPGPMTLQLTVMSVALLTVAVNCCVAPATTLGEDGVTRTLIAAGGLLPPPPPQEASNTTNAAHNARIRK